MATQLRLVDPPAPKARRSRNRGGPSTAGASSAVARSRATRAAATSRRVPAWGDWQLDARTRLVGRNGVAAARRMLERARASRELRRAS